MKNNLPCNKANLMNKDDARDYLEYIGFFKDDKNKELFEAGEIEVYWEPWAMEGHLIVQAATKEMIVCEDRGM